MRTEITMPHASHGMETGVIARWLKAEGDSVQRGEAIVVIETDKAEVELDATVDGILREIRHHDGEEVVVGTVIGYVEHVERE